MQCQITDFSNTESESSLKILEKPPLFCVILYQFCFYINIKVKLNRVQKVKDKIK